jgi:hypothetical protein
MGAWVMTYGSPYENIWVDYSPHTEGWGDVSVFEIYGYTEYIRKDISDAHIEHLEDEKDYLQAELSMAIKTAFHRGAVEWTKLNYPKMYKSLKETNK